MRVCYLILCHKNQWQVQLLINQLDDKDVFFGVHVDKKSKITIPQKSNIFFVNDESRIDIKWGDMGMVTATLRLIKVALDHGLFDYVALLSGQAGLSYKKQCLY